MVDEIVEIDFFKNFKKTGCPIVFSSYMIAKQRILTFNNKYYAHYLHYWYSKRIYDLPLHMQFVDIEASEP